MTRSRSLVGAGLLVGSLLAAHPAFALDQADSSLTRVISSDAKKLQGELDRAVADGYRLVAGHAGVEVAIFERADDGSKRAYLFVDDVDKFLKEQKLQPGYRLVASTFGADQVWFGAIFERVEGDDRQRAYRFLKAGSTGGIRKKLVDEGGARGAAVIAVTAGGDGVGVILEDTPNAPDVAVISGNTGTLAREISAAAAKGLCVVDSDGIRGAIYVMQGCANGQAAPAYEVISTTKTGTFAKELNAATAKGTRFVSASLIGVEKKALMTYANEFVALVESAANAGAAPAYRVFAAVRLGTLGKEIEAAAQEGFRLAAFTTGPTESLVVMEKR
jgi:hypothetical protein